MEMCCPNFQVQKENNGNTTGKIPLKCKNVYIINFHIIRKPLHFLHVYHNINFMKTIHCFVFNFLSITFSWSHFWLHSYHSTQSSKTEKSLPSSSSFLSRLIICISVNMSGNLLMMWNRRH